MQHICWLIFFTLKWLGISWLGQPFQSHHSSQQRWTTESKMILRIWHIAPAVVILWAFSFTTWLKGSFHFWTSIHTCRGLHMLTLTWNAAAGNDGGGSKGWQAFYEEAVTCHPLIFMETSQRSGIHDSDILAFQYLSGCRRPFHGFMEIHAKLIKEWKDESYKCSWSIWKWVKFQDPFGA